MSFFLFRPKEMKKSREQLVIQILYPDKKKKASANKDKDASWEEFNKAMRQIGTPSIYTAFDLYTHVYSLRATLDYSAFIGYGKFLEDEKLKAKFYKKYEKEFYPKYREVLDAFDLPYLMQVTSKGGDRHTLFNSGIDEFHRYETLIRAKRGEDILK